MRGAGLCTSSSESLCKDEAIGFSSTLGWEEVMRIKTETRTELGPSIAQRTGNHCERKTPCFANMLQRQDYGAETRL